MNTTGETPVWYVCRICSHINGFNARRSVARVMQYRSIPFRTPKEPLPTGRDPIGRTEQEQEPVLKRRQ
mgnify:CR=1 FL=1